MEPKNLLLPEVSTEAMQSFLNGFAARLAPAEHARPDHVGATLRDAMPLG